MSKEMDARIRHTMRLLVNEPGGMSTFDVGAAWRCWWSLERWGWAVNKDGRWHITEAGLEAWRKEMGR
jgi:hypothetical protein